MLHQIPQKVVVVKDDAFENDLANKSDPRQNEIILDKARSVSKNLRSALNEAEMLQADSAEDREFDFIWNKLHEDAEKRTNNGANVKN